MPELPEVEVVRRGLPGARSAGRTVRSVEVLHPRAVRRHEPGADDFAARLTGRTAVGHGAAGASTCGCRCDGAATPLRRAPRDERAAARAAGRRRGRDAPARAADASSTTAASCRFVDQRTFGGLSVAALDADGVPEPVVAHRPRPAGPRVRRRGVRWSALRRRRTGLKRALLDQTLVSGIGNIYADEALWRARLHYARATETLRRPEAQRLLGHVREVMGEALAQGGTSFDSLYVDVNGRERVLRPVARRVRAGGRAVPAVRDADPPGPVHEPLVVHLPALPAAPPPRPLVARLVCVRRRRSGVGSGQRGGRPRRPRRARRCRRRGPASRPRCAPTPTRSRRT